MSMAVVSNKMLVTKSSGGWMWLGGYINSLTTPTLGCISIERDEKPGLMTSVSTLSPHHSADLAQKDPEREALCSLAGSEANMSLFLSRSPAVTCQHLCSPLMSNQYGSQGPKRRHPPQASAAKYKAKCTVTF